jgi:exopolyphosphatase / guanosine-5'-triphosphate,3'-diphosphate pyrophosphatase
MTPGSLLVRIDDHQVVVELVGGAAHVLPVGPCSLVDGPLEGADPPPPANLTNALGLVHDHLDDLLIESPSIAAATTIVITGRHAEALSCVEIGTQVCPDRHELERSAADEVFRTLVGECAEDRRHNPGLPGDQVDTIIGTCCVVLGIMRRLDRGSVVVERSATEEDVR